MKASPAGFWAVARAGVRLSASGWRFWGLSMRGSRRIQLAGLPWKLEQMIYVGQAQGIRKTYVSLSPENPTARRLSKTPSFRKNAARRLREWGYLRRTGKGYSESLFFEKAFQRAREAPLPWNRLRAILEGSSRAPLPPKNRFLGEVISAMLPRLPSLLKEGWTVDHLDLRGPERSLQVAGRSWTLHSALYWFRREGITLLTDAQAGPFSRAEAKGLPDVFRQFRREYRMRGLVISPEWRSWKRWVMMDAARTRIPARRVMPAVRRLGD